MATNSEMLAEIDAAIVDILQNGQEMATVMGVKYTKANIDTLFKRREKFAQKANTSDNFFSRMKTGIPRR